MTKAVGLLRDESGLTSTEYALLASMVSLAIPGGVLLLSAVLSHHYGKVSDGVIAVSP